MNFTEWESIYEEILREFKFNRADDERAARILSELLSQRGTACFSLRALEQIIKGKHAIICGKAPRLAHDVTKINLGPDNVIIAADGATSPLLVHGIMPQVIVSDLDGGMADIIEANRRCAILVVHAHGDNVERLKAYVPKLHKIIGTTQSRPLFNVHNFGGFTDGDRAVYIALEFGARDLNLVGFDFNDETVTVRKKQKLKWAKRLVERVDVTYL